jgi:hypothetical protein
LRFPARERARTLDPAPMIFSRNMTANPKSLESEFVTEPRFVIE